MVQKKSGTDDGEDDKGWKKKKTEIPPLQFTENSHDRLMFFCRDCARYHFLLFSTLHFLLITTFSQYFNPKRFSKGSILTL